jgi:hypothetical protein
MDGAMRTPIFHLQHILDAFKRKKVLTKEELLKVTGCSTMTAWRLLSQHGYYTSYNDNARHYTIAGIPKFDEHGLWIYRKARFSKWGSLTKTIIGLVQESPAGLTAEQLQQVLKLKNVKPHLTRLIEKKSLAREKWRDASSISPFRLLLKESNRNRERRKPNRHEASRLYRPWSRSSPCWSKSSGDRKTPRDNGLVDWHGKAFASQPVTSKPYWTTIKWIPKKGS